VKTPEGDPATSSRSSLTWPSVVSKRTPSRYSATTTRPRKLHLHIRAIKAGKLTCALSSDGTCVRDYIHVIDLAEGHLLALDALGPSSAIFSSLPAEAPRYKAYNLGKGKGMSVLQIVEAMRKATGFDYKTTIIGRRRGDVPDLTADPALAEKELGFSAPRDLETMCKDLWNWQSKNPEGYDAERK
jgi:nucleoside-diphosphate-sugar epimerase